MSEKNFITGINSSNYLDGNLNTSVNVNEGDTILIIGTATRGPINKPIKVADDIQAMEIFGPVSATGKETLLTKFLEVYYGPNGKKDIRLCRISNGVKAKIQIPEMLGTGLKATTPNKYALTLEALYPGEIYNSISIYKTNIDGESYIAITNPISGETSTFKYNLVNPSSDEISNVDELAYAINTDSNLNSILKATLEKFNQDVELVLQKTLFDV